VSRPLVEFLHVQVSLCVVSFQGCAVSGNGVTEGSWLCWPVGVVEGYNIEDRVVYVSVCIIDM
jgi:hypothetical protein